MMDEFKRTETFYLRAGGSSERRRMYEQCGEWRPTVVNGQEMNVTSFEFTDFLSDRHLRLVVQRTKMAAEQGELFLPGNGYRTSTRRTGGCTTGPSSTPSLDEPHFGGAVVYNPKWG